MSTITKLWKEPRCPSTDEWIKKRWYVYPMEYHAAIKRNEILPFAMTWMELEGFMLSEIGKSERQLSYDLPDMRKLRGNVRGLGGRKGINEANRIGRETNRKRLLI